MHAQLLLHWTSAQNGRFSYMTGWIDKRSFQGNRQSRASVMLSWDNNLLLMTWHDLMWEDMMSDDEKFEFANLSKWWIGVSGYNFNFWQVIKRMSCLKFSQCLGNKPSLMKQLKFRNNLFYMQLSAILRSRLLIRDTEFETAQIVIALFL